MLPSVALISSGNPGDVESLTRFQSFVKLKRAALQFIAYQLSQEDLKQMRSAFRAIDTDNSGKISLSEVSRHSGVLR